MEFLLVLIFRVRNMSILGVGFCVGVDEKLVVIRR